MHIFSSFTHVHILPQRITQELRIYDKKNINKEKEISLCSSTFKGKGLKFGHTEHLNRIL